MEAQDNNIVIQGHRGCRGLFPENTIPAFEHALNLGVSTLEMDVVITSDNEVLVSHEPWMNSTICRMPDGSAIPKSDEKDQNIFQMTLAQCGQYPCGLDPHPKFPDQKQITTNKPSLKEVVDLVRKSGIDVAFNIELKSRVKWDSLYHPDPAEFASIFLLTLADLGIDEQTTLQSFDPRMLEHLHQADPSLKLVYLSDDKGKSVAKKLDELTFVPWGYSCHYKLTSPKTVEECRALGVHLSVWTVNKPRAMKKLIKMGVRDIISDYPDQVIDIATQHDLIVVR